MSAPCGAPPVTTPALDIPVPNRLACCQMASDLALLNNVAITVVGTTDDGTVVLCPEQGCCELTAARSLVVVPDVEVVARWGSVPRAAQRQAYRRSDGRTTYLFQGGAEAAR